MIIESIIIGRCLYVFCKDKRQKQKEKAINLSKKLTSSPVLYTDDFSFRQQITDIISPFTDSARNQQLLDINQKELLEKEETYKKSVDKNLKLSTAMFGAAVAGFVFPPLRLVALGGLLWGSIPIYKMCYKRFVEDPKVTGLLVDTIALTGMLATGYWALSALDEMVYYAGEKLLLKTEIRSVNKRVNLFNQQPKFVWLILKDNVEVKIPFGQLEKGNIISVHTGEMVPTDGKIVYGNAMINQQSLTGESQPVEKSVGDSCFATTMVLEGHLHLEVTKAGDESVAAQIGKVLNSTLDYTDVLVSKGRIVSDKSAQYISGISLLSLPIVGMTGGVAIINTNFSHILELVTPMIMLNFLTIASQEGILIKDGRSLESLHKVDTVVFDKTGTLTLTQPHIGKIWTMNGLSENELLAYAAAAEFRQTHPIALAILQESEHRELIPSSIDKAKYEVGFGIKVEIDGRIIHVGSAKFMKMEGILIEETIETLTKEGHQKGYSFVHVAVDQQLEGIIELHPTIRPEAKRIIKELQASNKTCYIISGDHEMPTAHLAKELGVEHYFSEVLPEDKANLVEKLQQTNKTVCFVGDGINDSIALKKADVSISIKGASYIATDTAQIILTSENLNQLPLLFTLGKQFEQHMNRNITSNIAPASFVIGGVFFLHFGLAAALLANAVSLVVGTGNAIHPMVTYQQAKKEKQLMN